LLDLVFVQLTGAAARHWIALLFALGAASPLLGRMRRWLPYRLTWNLSVIAIFALLVRHTSSGIQHLLHDSLLLAAFCQAPPPNNLGPPQRPDLLFVNSFLIALVTSFFCRDVTFAAVFAAYAWTLTMAMQLGCAADNGIERTPGLARAGAVNALATLILT